MPRPGLPEPLSPCAGRIQKEQASSFGYSIEQPQGISSKLLRLRDIENPNLPLACTKVTFDQCKAGRTRWRKRTQVWISNNLPTLIKFLGDPKFKCTPKSPCWRAAPWSGERRPCALPPAPQRPPRLIGRRARRMGGKHEHVTGKNSKASAKYPAELVTAWAQCVDADLAHLRCQPCE